MAVKLPYMFKGKFADQSISGSFNIDLKSPTEGINQLANQLLATNFPKATYQNGSCTRPNVTRPDISESSIAAFKREAKNNPNIKDIKKVETEERPSWAGDLRFVAEKEDQWNTEMINIRNNNSNNSFSNNRPSHTNTSSGSNSPQHFNDNNKPSTIHSSSPTLSKNERNKTWDKQFIETNKFMIDSKVTQAQINAYLKEGNAYYKNENYKKAYEAFLNAAIGGSPDGQFAIGVLYASDKGVTHSNGY